MGELNKYSQMLFPLLMICVVAAVVFFVTGYGKKHQFTSGALPAAALPVAAAPVAQTTLPEKVDATTSASFKLEPYIPYHDTLKKYAYSMFAGQHQVISGVVQRAEKAVVCLGVMETFGNATRLRNLSSGLIVDARGYVLTTASTLFDYENFKVILFEGNHRHMFDGILETVDPAANLALIKIRNYGTFILPFFSIWDYAPVTVGDWVIASGSTDGLHLVAMQGMVSSINRSKKNEGRYFYDLIQTDLKIEGAMMGSPVFDIQGNFVGHYIGDGLVQPINEMASPIFGMNGLR